MYLYKGVHMDMIHIIMCRIFSSDMETSPELQCTHMPDSFKILCKINQLGNFKLLFTSKLKDSFNFCLVVTYVVTIRSILFDWFYLNLIFLSGPVLYDYGYIKWLLIKK